MKSRHSIRSFLAGVLTTILLLTLAAPVWAAVTKMIEVSTGVTIYVDDVQINPTDAQGHPVEPFIYKGTTYLPVRAVSEALQKPVQWDGATRSVYLGSHSSDQPAAYLGQMDYFTKKGGWETDALTKDNLGKEHTHSIAPGDSGSGSITYKLNGQYRRLTATFYQEYDARMIGACEATLIISGDGKQLWQGTVGPGIDPINIDVDITGVLELTLEYPPSRGKLAYNSALGDVALWT